MSEKRFIRDIQGNILDMKKDKWFEEDWKGKPLDYDDDLIVFLNEQECTISALKEENEQLRNKLEVANARSGYYQRMLEKWCVKDE